jgi:hypothetical protein
MHRHRAEAETQIVVGYHPEMLAGAFAFVLFVRSHDYDRTDPSEKRRYLLLSLP